MYKVSRSFPRTPGVHPSSPLPSSVFCHPSTFISLVAFSRRAPSSFRRLGFLPRGPIPQSSRLLPYQAAYSFRPCDRPARVIYRVKCTREAEFFLYVFFVHNGFEHAGEYRRRDPRRSKSLVDSIMINNFKRIVKGIMNLWFRYFYTWITLRNCIKFLW